MKPSVALIKKGKEFEENKEYAKALDCFKKAIE